jgi:thiamine biosynthesis lipoprotein
MAASIRRARPLLGTIVEIVVVDASANPEHSIECAFDNIANVHRLMSFHDPESEVSRLNREAAIRPVRVDGRTARVLQFALDVNERSGGAFDISVARHLQALNLLPIHQGDETVVLGAPANSQTIEMTPDGNVRFHDPAIRIDLGGVAKGFAVDSAVDALRSCGVCAGLVNAGGDIFAFGKNTWPVHIRDPRAPSRLLCELALCNEAVASSAGRFDPFLSSGAMATTIVDPRTGESAGDLIGASVRASSCMVADALTKVVMLLGESASACLEHFHASALLIRGEADIIATANWRETRLAS